MGYIGVTPGILGLYWGVLGVYGCMFGYHLPFVGIISPCGGYHIPFVGIISPCGGYHIPFHLQFVGIVLPFVGIISPGGGRKDIISSLCIARLPPVYFFMTSMHKLAKRWATAKGEGGNFSLPSP